MREIKLTEIMPDEWLFLFHPEANRIGICLGQNSNSTTVFIDLQPNQGQKLIEGLQEALNKLRASNEKAE